MPKSTGKDLEDTTTTREHAGNSITHGLKRAPNHYNQGSEGLVKLKQNQQERAKNKPNTPRMREIFGSVHERMHSTRHSEMEPQRRNQNDSQDRRSKRSDPPSRDRSPHRNRGSRPDRSPSDTEPPKRDRQPKRDDPPPSDDDDPDSDQDRYLSASRFPSLHRNRKQAPLQLVISNSSKEPQFDFKLKFESVPKWDGNTDTLPRWIIKVTNLALMSDTVYEQLGRVVPRRLEGAAEVWYWSLPVDYRDEIEENWDTLKDAITEYYLNPRANLVNASAEEEEAQRDYEELYFGLESESDSEDSGVPVRTYKIELEKGKEERPKEPSARTTKPALNRRTRRRLAREIARANYTVQETEGSRATQAHAHIGSLDEETHKIIIDSGSDITLISEGRSSISGFVDLDLYFLTDEGPIKLTVEASISNLND
ncbi:hypothetical protein NLJ89_g9533 [Agrocybe chaxingu]|uniref:Uncharacterized protein n=1 Tax=Agrocybe chaxingu TaxID=84603 RepID=A0A9W8MT06_9AGAR|nr:hypothetical protein NLJ89_g9533 [Agrocybe chaxingu]